VLQLLAEQIHFNFQVCGVLVKCLIYLLSYQSQCRLHDSISADDDDEYRSSRNIAISLLKRFKNAVDRGGGDNLKVYSLVFGWSVIYSVTLLSCSK
jgi:hypothetical protein